MEIKKTVVVVGDGIADDTDAIRQHMQGTAIAVRPDGTPIDQAGGTFRIMGTIYLTNPPCPAAPGS